MTLLALLPLALAAPDRLATAFPVTGGVGDVATSPDGNWVLATTEGGDEVVAVDTGSWSSTALVACGGVAGIAFIESASGWSAYVGCETGSVLRVNLDDSQHAATIETEAVGTFSARVLALETDGVYLWAILEGDGNPQADALDPATGARPDAFSSLPSTLGNGGLEDTVVLGDLLMVIHGQDDVGKVDLMTGSASTNSDESMSVDLVDAYPYNDGNRLWAADENGSVVYYTASNTDLVLDLQDIAEKVTAVTLEPDEGWFVAATSDGAMVFPLADANVTDEATATITGAIGVGEMAAIAGYAFAGTEDGDLLVLTGNPWLDVQSDADSLGAVIDGSVVTLTITSDEAGEYEILRGSDTLGTGTVDADTSVDVPLTVDAWAEGQNRVWVYVTGDDGDQGHDAVDIVVDNPPSTPALTADDVGWGEARVVVTIPGIDDEDLESYDVYVSTTSFSAADYPSGGPEDFDPDDGLTLPENVSAEPGEDVEVSVSPLQNGVTYYVAVRARDASQESAMSDVFPVTPDETYSAAELAGETGGFCGTTGAGSAGFVGVLLAGAALLRRRGLPLAAAALVLPSVARAEPREEFTPRNAQVQVRVGGLQLTDADLGEVFGASGHRLWELEYGWSSRFLEVGAGLGWMREEGWQVSSTGEESVDADNLTLIPLTVTLTGRLEIVQEQFLVPFGRIGADATIFTEDWDVPADSTAQSTVKGMKYGWHYGGGLALLLDTLDPEGAARLEGRSGINDTYIVAEYRRTPMFTQDEGYDLGRQGVSFGLKFDF